MPVVPVSEVEAGGSGLQSHPQQYRDSQVSLGYIRPRLETHTPTPSHTTHDFCYFLFLNATNFLFAITLNPKAHKDKFPNYSLVPLFANILNWDSTT